ncbi:hypothetical protein [Balneola vulgaris]|uniref:hypothetical protein n=1 Tax=Balneola vulgaris TaxID=287535 RepID=UPI0003820E1D|nr:hypothetical protein [Balneola vulgaris]
MLKKITLLTPLFLLLSFISISVAQEVTIDKSGVETTDYGKVISYYDPFTDHLTIGTHNNVMLELNESVLLKMSPLFNGRQTCYQLECGSFIIIISSDDTTIVDLFDFSEDVFSQKDYPVLFSNYRDELTVSVLNENFEVKNDLNDFSSSILAIEFNSDQINRFIDSQSTRIRIEGNVISFGEELKSDFIEIKKVLKKRRSEYKDKREVEDTAPFELRWEGNIERDLINHVLPTNTSNNEVVISLRFQVKPDGSVGLIIPLKKMNPELEREIQRSFRSWRFSRLPPRVPQKAQWGTITFRFF